MTNNIPSLNKVILPMLRRVLPSVIAHDIIGVQPMSGPTGQIFSMKTRYSYVPLRIKLDKQHYNTFLRLYNRRKFTYHKDIIAAGYFSCDVLYDKDIITWCDENFGKYGYINDNGYTSMFYFENINDQTLFKMRWL